MVFQNKFPGGTDATNYSYPQRYYLWESLKNGDFPFWTEKIFGGFPIYADTETAFLNPINILSVIILGPFNSYKLLHFCFYYLGALSLIYLLKREGFSLIGSLAASLVYYSSFFSLYHQEHFSITLTTYLIPAGLLVTNLFIESHKIRWLCILSAITSSLIYFGSFQMVLIFLIPTFAYLVIFGYEKYKLKRLTIYLCFYVFLTWALSIPLLIPAMQLYLNSTRSLEGVSYTEGSFNPMMLANTTHPYIFGMGSDYKWNTVSNDYLIHETSIYVGITTFIIGLFGFFTIWDRKTKLFLQVILISFLYLAFIKYVPILGNIKLPIIGLFRYWGRSVVLFSLFLAVCVGKFLTSPVLPSFKKIIRDKFIYIALCLYLSEIIYSFFVDKTSKVIITQLQNGILVKNSTFYILLGLLILTLLLCALLIKYKRSVLLKTLLFFVIFGDLIYFGIGIIKNNVTSIENIYNKNIVKITENHKNQRIVILDTRASRNSGLYLKSWGIVGDSQFRTNKHDLLVSNLGIYKSKYADQNSPGLAYLWKAGVTKVIDGKGNVLSSYPNSSFLSNFDGKLLGYEAKEGAFDFVLTSDSTQTLNTYVSNYPGWQVFVNSKLVSYSNELNFIGFTIPAGNVHVRMVFVPKIFYYSLAASVAILSLTIFAIAKNKINSAVRKK